MSTRPWSSKLRPGSPVSAPRAIESRTTWSGAASEASGSTARSSPVEINFPFLSVHPDRDEVFRTNARLTETYDQIAMLGPRSHGALPHVPANASAGRGGADDYDYGMFNFVALFCEALGVASPEQMGGSEARSFFASFEHDVTDHMPIWVRLPIRA